MEVRFRLNAKNQKDKVIMEFLSSQYDAKEFIKAIIYKMAMGDNGVSTIDSYSIRNNNKSSQDTLIDGNEGENRDTEALIEEFKEFF